MNVKKSLMNTWMCHLLDKFKKQIIAGTHISNNDSSCGKCFDNNLTEQEEFQVLKRASCHIQDSILNYLADNDGIVIPSGWVGHSIALIVKPSASEGHFDLTIVNAGAGIDYHYNTPDPESIYPALSQIWIEFHNIPKDDLFSLIILGSFTD